MINLITPEAKKELIVEYWTRVVSVWLMLWSIALLAGASLMIPVYVLVSSQINSYGDSAAEASAKVLSYGDVSTSLKKATDQAKIIVEESEMLLFSDLISLLGGLEGNNIAINKMSFKREKDKIETISLSGEATDRQSLASFRDRLLAEERIAEVDLPISNLAQEKEISFTISVKLNENEV